MTRIFGVGWMSRSLFSHPRIWKRCRCMEFKSQRQAYCSAEVHKKVHRAVAFIAKNRQRSQELTAQEAYQKTLGPGKFALKKGVNSIQGNSLVLARNCFTTVESHTVDESHYWTPGASCNAAPKAMLRLKRNKPANRAAAEWWGR